MLTAIKFAKVRPDAKIPTKRVEDAALDIYPCFDKDWMRIAPHETVMIPTGIASACDADYCFVLKERGSTGTRGMAQRCGVVDSGYRAEWFVPITNTTAYPIYIAKKECVNSHGSVCVYPQDRAVMEQHVVYPYEKAICQALVVPVPELDIEEYTLDELQSIPSERGEGRLGSSGK